MPTTIPTVAYDGTTPDPVEWANDFVKPAIEELQASGVGVDPNDVGYDIVVAVGQSNASRTGSPVLVDVYDTPNPRIWQYAAGGTYVNKIIRAIDPLEFPSADLGTWVANAMQFSREWVKRVPVNRQVLIVPAAVGGSSLVGGPWAVGGTYYNNTVSLTNAAVAAAGPNSRVVAFLWIQGEAESVGGTSQATYAAALDLMIAGFRSAITGASTTPFVVGSMVPEWRNTPNGSSLAIHAAHVATPGRVANTFFVDGPTGMHEGSGFPTGGIHYTAQGQREMGKRMCEALWADPDVPGQVVGLSGIAGSGQVILSWSPVTAIPTVSDYSVQYKASSSGTWLTFADGTSTTPSATVTGLTNGIAHDFRVAAINAQGTGIPSATATQTPATTSLPDPTYLADIRTLGVGDGSAITTLVDQSTNVNNLDATQGTSGSRPTFRSTGFNGGPSIEFDGGDSLGINAIPDFVTNGAGEYTVVCVFSVANTSSEHGLIGLRSDSAGLFHLMVQTGGEPSFSTLVNSGSISNATVPTVPINTRTIIIGTRDSTGAKLYKNGTAGTFGVAAGVAANASIYPFTIGRVSNSLWPHAGHIAYVAIYPGVLSTAQRNLVETTLMTDFGITP